MRFFEKMQETEVRSQRGPDSEGRRAGGRRSEMPVFPAISGYFRLIRGGEGAKQSLEPRWERRLTTESPRHGAEWRLAAKEHRAKRSLEPMERRADLGKGGLQAVG